MESHGGPDRDEGTSLVEVLVAIAILGIAVPGLLAGLGSAALGSGIHRGEADAHAVLVSAAETLRDDARNPFDCNLATYKPLLGVTLPDGWTATNVQLVTATAESGYWFDGGFQPTTCGSATDLQRLTLKATSPDGRASEQLTLFKRRP